MTCIVGFVDKENKRIYMGGDSAGVGNYNIRSRKDEKVFIKGDMLIGYTSSFRMGQLLRFKLEVPLHPDQMDTYEYMCTLFIDKVRECLKTNGYATVKENTETIGTFLVGYKGRLFNISDDLQVGENNYSYDSCGCGENYAIAAIHALDFYGHDALTSAKIVEVALKTAAEFSAGVRAPFIIRELEGWKE